MLPNQSTRAGTGTSTGAFEEQGTTLSLEQKDLNFLSNYPHLKKLSLHGSKEKCDLNLWGCKQLSDLSPLAGLAQLTSLNLGSCEQLSDLSPLSRLTQLTRLSLDCCEQLSDLSPLSRLIQLTNLSLWKV